MDIQSIGFLNEPKIWKNADIVKNSENNFGELFGKITGGELAGEIRDNYNVNLNVGNIADCQQFLNSNDLRGTNHIIISPTTLSKMENNPALKEKVLDAIKEFCSQEEQAEIKALQPPVKSAGMIIYPDGEVLYWLEGYPNEFGNEEGKNSVIEESNIGELLQDYCITDFGMELQPLAPAAAGKRQREGV